MSFHFNCKVKTVKKSYLGGKSGAQITSDLYLLIPEQSTESDKFLDVWKPTEKYKKPETPVIVDSPVDSSGVVQVCIPDTHSEGKHYLHVMTPKLEAKLSMHIGKTVMVQIPDGDDGEVQEAD